MVPQLVLQDDAGLRTTCTGSAVALDGRAQPVPDCATAAGLRLVAVALRVVGDAGFVQPGSNIAVTMTLPGGHRPGSGVAVDGQSGLARSRAAHESDRLGRRDRLRMSAAVQFSDPNDSSRVLVATAFPDPGPVPIAVSARFAQEVSAHRGSRLSLNFDATPVDAVVAEIVPTVPSAPGAAAALADVDSAVPRPGRPGRPGLPGDRLVGRRPGNGRCRGTGRRAEPRRRHHPYR